MSPGLLLREVPGDRLVVAIDPGKVIEPGLADDAASAA